MRIDVYFHCDSSDLISKIEQRLKEQEDKTMGLTESFDALSTEVDRIIADVATLKQQVANGSPVTVEQLDALTAKLQAGE